MIWSVRWHAWRMCVHDLRIELRFRFRLGLFGFRFGFPFGFRLGFRLGFRFGFRLGFRFGFGSPTPAIAYQLVGEQTSQSSLVRISSTRWVALDGDCVSKHSTVGQMCVYQLSAISHRPSAISCIGLSLRRQRCFEAPTRMSPIAIILFIFTLQINQRCSPHMPATPPPPKQNGCAPNPCSVYCTLFPAAYRWAINQEAI